MAMKFTREDVVVSMVTSIRATVVALMNGAITGRCAGTRPIHSAMELQPSELPFQQLRLRLCW
jgi:hypothetical protein